MGIRTLLFFGIISSGFGGIYLADNFNGDLDDIEGVVYEIEDADGFFVDDGEGRTEEIRLYGIDAPEWNQTCRTRLGKIIPCGREAAKALSDDILNQRVECSVKTKDRWSRLVAICRHDNIDIGESAVEEGRAWAYSKYSKKYILTELKARRDKKGYWEGSWISPWQYRKIEAGIIHPVNKTPKK